MHFPCTAEKLAERFFVAKAALRVMMSIAFGFLIGMGSSSAQTLTIATGEYEPFVSEKLPQGGVTAQIVTAAFKSQGAEIAFDYVPWKRGFEDSRSGRYAGTFPYLKTAEREAEFLYSDAIIADRLRLFARSDKADARGGSGKSICIPIGYDQTMLQGFISKNNLTVESPVEMINCFKMLESGRVNLIWSSEAVASNLIDSLFGKKSQIIALDEALAPATEYFFIVAKKHPDAAALIARFNAGLKQIKSNGSYAKITGALVVPERGKKRP
jgi:polar amino acid transport system substrate-binding protein